MVEHSSKILASGDKAATGSTCCRLGSELSMIDLATNQNSVHFALEILALFEVVSIKVDGSAWPLDQVAIAEPEQKESIWYKTPRSLKT